MKIKALHISAFGGIKNLDLTLAAPFSVVYGDNENGKTTIMNFIKMMFYGTDRSGSQLNKNPRKKYAPWDGSQMAGSIDFETNGREYRLERIFASSNSTDKVTLTDLGLGDRTTVAADIGTKLFGLTASAFERSIFIGQFGFPESNSLAEGELNSKLSNIALTGDEAVSFDAVNERLLNAKYELMSKSGRSGIYDKNIRTLAELQKQLEKSQADNETIQKANQKALEISKNIKVAQEQANVLKSQIESENDFRNAKKLKELLNLKAELDTLNQRLALGDGELADEMFVRKVEFCLSKIDGINQKIKSKENEIAIIENNLSLALNPISDATPEKAREISQKIEDLENDNKSLSERITILEQAPAKKTSPLFFVLAAVFGILGIAAFLWQTIAAIVGLAIALIFICIGITMANTAKSQAAKTQNEILNLKLKQNSLISVIASEKANLTAINAALNSNTAMIESQKDSLQKAKNELSELSADYNTESDVLFELFSALKKVENIDEIISLLSEIKESATKQKELKQNINYILKDVGNISYDEVREKLDSLKTDTNIDFEALKTEYENLLQKITENKTLVASILTEVKSLSANAKNSESLKQEIKTLEQKIASQKDYCNYLDIAISVLTDSYAEVRRSYGSALEKKASEIFVGLTDGRYKNMSISKSFDITVEKSDLFGVKELEYLSSGTQDQAYLSLRLALSSLMGEEGNSLPVVLDDALAQYDDTRTEAAIKFLKEYSSKGQIILFTCHSTVADIAKEFDANQISL